MQFSNHQLKKFFVKRRKWTIKFNIWLCVSVVLSLAFAIGYTPSNAFASSALSGFVFRDTNANGIRDRINEVGVAGVTVTAYDDQGFNQGSTTTAADGAYTLTAGGVGPYRIEFTTLPAGLQPGAFGAQSGTTVQFVTGSEATDINLGLSSPAEYCENNPNLAINCLIAGNPLQTGPNGLSATGDQTTLAYFPYNASGQSGQDTSLATAKETGAATWGLACTKSSARFAS